MDNGNSRFWPGSGYPASQQLRVQCSDERQMRFERAQCSSGATQRGDSRERIARWNPLSTESIRKPLHAAERIAGDLGKLVNGCFS